MATLTFVPYQGGQIHAERTNDYISNGHGDEVLSRTNRYVTGEHACGNRCEGVNCPSDPVLASELMESLRIQYENNLAGRKTKGARTDEEGAAHYQLIISWHTDESVSPAERYEMGRELIQRTKLKNHANLMSAHDNTDEDHLHLSTSAFSLDGTHKLCMNNRLLYELRREMDRICVEHGYSIVECPELWGDKAYKEWFDCVKELDAVTVHPPLPRESKRKKSQKQQYADAKKEEREEEERRKAELTKRRRMTSENRGTHFYSLPHIYSPDKPDDQLYVYALDPEGKRRSPLQLDYSLQYVWARACSDRMAKMPDFQGKKALMLKMHWTEQNAWAAYSLMERLDIGTRAELEAHTKAVGGDISRFKQEIARQGKVIASAQESGDTAKLGRAEARKAHAEKMLMQRKAEYRELKHAAGVLASMDNGEHWTEFRNKLLEGSTKRLSVTERNEKVIRENYRDIGQLVGIPQNEIDSIIDKAKRVDDVQSVWVEVRGNMRVTFTRRASGISVLYNSLRDDYADRRQLRSSWRQFQRSFPIVGPITAILYIALAIPMAILETKREQAIEFRIAHTKRLIEEIKWHNKNCEEQFKTAKTMLALKLLSAEGAAVDEAWREFEAACDEIMEKTAKMQTKEALYLAGSGEQYKSSVRSMQKQIDKTMAMRSPALSDLIGGAEKRRDEQAAAKGYQPKEKEEPSW